MERSCPTRPRAIRQVCLLAAALLLAACAHRPAAVTAQPCGSPPADADWPVAAAAEAGFDAAALCNVLTEVAGSEANIHSLLVERGGKLVAELYRSGPDSSMEWMFGLRNPFDANVASDAHKLHDARSVSKSITALVVGIEIAKGTMPAPDTPIVAAVPELADLAHDGHGAITLAHLLTMSSGLAWQEWGHSPLTSDEIRLFWKQDTTRFVMDRSLAATPGSSFRYSGGNTQLLGELLRQRTGKSVAELAQEELFAPMGVRDWKWVDDTHGRPLAFVGLRLRPRDMLKFGRLVNQRGAWRGQQLVPADWIERATHQRVPSGFAWFSVDGRDAGYGYQWWTGHLQWHGQDLEWASAVGNGGQRVFVVPALDLSIVMTAGDYGELGIHREEDRILAAIVAALQPQAASKK